MSDVLDQWAKASIRDVLLPSGQEARVRLPDPEIFFRAGRFPSDLRGMALRFVAGGLDASKIVDEKEAILFLRFGFELAAYALRELRDRETGEWQPVTLTGEELHEQDVAQEDIAALIDIAGRRRTPAQVTMQARLDGAVSGVLADADRATKEAADTAGDALPAWSGFRDERRRVASGTDGPDIRDATVEPDRDSRPIDRVRSRRGASGSPGRR